MKKIFLLIFILSLINLTHSIAGEVKGSFIVTDFISPGSCNTTSGYYTFIIPGTAEYFTENYNFRLGIQSPSGEAECTIYAQETEYGGIVCKIDAGSLILKNSAIKLLSKYSFDFDIQGWNDYVTPNYMIDNSSSCEPEYDHEFIYYETFIDRGCEINSHNRTLGNFGYYKNYTKKYLGDKLHFTMDILSGKRPVKGANCTIDTTIHKTKIFGPEKEFNILECSFHDYGYIHYKLQYPFIEETGTRIKIHNDNFEDEIFSDCKGKFICFGYGFLLVELLLLLLF